MQYTLKIQSIYHQCSNTTREEDWKYGKGGREEKSSANSFNDPQQNTYQNECIGGWKQVDKPIVIDH